jgi:hypothetical protein
MSPQFSRHHRAQRRPDRADADHGHAAHTRHPGKLLLDRACVIQRMQAVVSKTFRHLEHKLTGDTDRPKDLKARLRHCEPVAANQSGSQAVRYAGHGGSSGLMAGISQRAFQLSGAQQRVLDFILLMRRACAGNCFG